MIDYEPARKGIPVHPDWNEAFDLYMSAESHIQECDDPEAHFHIVGRPNWIRGWNYAKAHGPKVEECCA